MTASDTTTESCCHHAHRQAQRHVIFAGCFSPLDRFLAAASWRHKGTLFLLAVSPTLSLSPSPSRLSAVRLPLVAAVGRCLPMPLAWHGGYPARALPTKGESRKHESRKTRNKPGFRASVPSCFRDGIFEEG